MTTLSELVAVLDGGGAGLHIGTTAPTDKVAKPLWWDTDSGRILVYFSSENVWVDASAERDIVAHDHAVIKHAGSTKVAAQTGGIAVTGDAEISGDCHWFYSDERLKDIHRHGAPGALAQVQQWEIISYTGNELAGSYGFDTEEMQLGFTAQSVVHNTPEAFAPAPFDTDADGTSLSGDNFITLKDRPIIAKLAAAVQEIAARLEQLEAG